jgi:lipopolysaccharide/colanic/teichoic acid biosynthesis glycosyltransferase
MDARCNDHDRSKRCLELVAVPVAILLLAPLFMGISLLVFAQLGRPIFYRGARIGKQDRVFHQLKFRTMIENTHGHDGRLLSDDERLTRFGRLLRKTSLDELPQLFNVLFGQMSLIGPRPLPPHYLPRYSPSERRRHDVRPGLTGLAQANGRNELSWAERFELDIAYVDGATFLVDAKILMKTVLMVVRASGVSAAGHATCPEFLGAIGPPARRLVSGEAMGISVSLNGAGSTADAARSMSLAQSVARASRPTELSQPGGTVVGSLASAGGRENDLGANLGTSHLT